MSLRKAGHVLLKKRTLALAALIFGVVPTSALAAVLSGDGTLIGTDQPDQITAGQENDMVYGLKGSDTIRAGNGNDLIDGDGGCPPGSQDTVSSGSNGSNYCSDGHGNDQGQEGGASGQGDNISAGNGNDRVYGGGGHNTISVGTGDDTIYGGPLGDKITAGRPGSDGNDKVYLDYQNRGNVDGTYTGSTVTVALGDDVVYAQNRVKDTINCPRGNQTTVYADSMDYTKGCHRVVYTSPARDRLARRTALRRTHRKPGRKVHRTALQH